MVDKKQPDASADADVTETNVTKKPRSRGGFASMEKERLREIARSGGRAVHARGTAHRFTREEARAAGQKGGNAPHVSRGRPRPRNA